MRSLADHEAADEGNVEPPTHQAANSLLALVEGKVGGAQDFGRLVAEPMDKLRGFSSGSKGGAARRDKGRENEG